MASKGRLTTELHPCHVRTKLETKPLWHPNGQRDVAQYHYTRAQVLELISLSIQHVLMKLNDNSYKTCGATNTILVRKTKLHYNLNSNYSTLMNDMYM